MAGAGGQHPPPGAAGGAAAGAGAAVTPVAASAGPGEDSSDSEAEQEGPQKLIRKVSTSGQIRTKVSRAGSGGSAPGAQGTAATRRGTPAARAGRRARRGGGGANPEPWGAWETRSFHSGRLECSSSCPLPAAPRADAPWRACPARGERGSTGPSCSDPALSLPAGHGLSPAPSGRPRPVPVPPAAVWKAEARAGRGTPELSDARGYPRPTWRQQQAKLSRRSFPLSVEFKS